MSYVVLARKWRPMRFEDLVGQEHVARTLGNAIQSGRIAHAFLFTGVRGVGKTTSARILAKTLCCLGDPETTPKGVDPGPTVTPCLKCAACLEIAQGTDVDVREIDGASYNGVDEVRKLQDSLPYRPARDRFKIFIVDEVHMLSQSAWNAFLKTLEEPPPHVKFIFATTEAHKVPITILSRVQRFDFRLIPTLAIVAQLRHVLGREGIESDDAALGIIAREAAGSMRDAMSLLDQVIAWGGAKLVADDVAQVLGVASRKVLHDIAGALVRGDAVRCLEVVAELANQGYDTAHVARDLLALLRDLVVAKVCAKPAELLDLADEEARDVGALAEAAGKDDLIRLHQGFSQGFDEVVRSGQPRSALEMLLVRLARRPPLLPLDEFVRRLSELERRLGSAAADSARPAPAPPVQPQRAPARARETRSAAPSRTEPSGDDRGEPPPALVTPLAFAIASERSPPAPANERVAPVSRARVEPPVEQIDAFRKILDRVHEERPELAARLSHAAILELSASELVLGFEPGSIFGSEAMPKGSLELVNLAISAHFGQELRLKIETDSARAAGIKTLAVLDAEATERQQRELLSGARRHRGITDAEEVLGARLKDLKLAQR